MPYDTPEELLDRSAWLTTDAAWVAQREQQWRTVYSKLAAPPRSTITAQKTKLLRDYFLAGRMEKFPAWEGHNFPSLPLFYRLWLHPDQSEGSWSTQVKLTIWSDYEMSVRSYTSVAGFQRIVLDGLDERIYDVLLGGDPVRSFLDDDQCYVGKRVWTSRSILSQYSLPDSLVASLVPALEQSGTDITFERIYSVRQMRAVFEHCGENVWSFLFADRKRIARLERLLELVLVEAEQSKGIAGQAVHERHELAHELTEIFDRGNGPARFQDLWQQHRRAAKANGTPRSVGAKSGSGSAASGKVSAAATRTRKSAMGRTGTRMNSAKKNAPAKTSSSKGRAK